MNSPVLQRLLWVRGLRAFADGYISLLLPIYLIALGMIALQVGVIATATLLGSGLFTLLVGLQAHRFTYRTQLLAACALMAATGFGFAAFSEFWPLLIIAFVGTLNPSSGDVSVFLPLEHAVLSHSVADRDRTALFARYSIVGATVAAFGSLSAGLPEVMATAMHISMKTALQAMFGFYGAIGLVSSLIASVSKLNVSVETGQVQQSYLGQSGVQATLHWQDNEPADVGELLLSSAFDLNADLLVMGCYGHNRAREWVLGGASRTVLQSMTMPVLMSH